MCRRSRKPHTELESPLTHRIYIHVIAGSPQTSADEHLYPSSPTKRQENGPGAVQGEITTTKSMTSWSLTDFTGVNIAKTRCVPGADIESDLEQNMMMDFEQRLKRYKKGKARSIWRC